MKKPIALISGITGQAGSYLAEFLLEKGYEVYGLYRRGSTDGIFDRINHLDGKIHLVCADLTDIASLEKAINEIRPDEIYNLAAQSHVGISFLQPTYTNDVNWLGVERIISCVKKYVPKAKMYQASSISFNEPVLIKVNSKIIRTSFEEVYKLWDKNKDIKVLTMNKEGKTTFKKIKNVIDHGKKVVYTVGLFNKVKLKLTGDHSLIIMGKNKFKNIKVTELKKGDNLITFCNSSPKFSKKEYKLRWSVCYKKYDIGNFNKNGGNKFNETTKNYSIPLNKEVAYMIGCFCAEGCCEWSNKQKRIAVTFGNHPSGNKALLNFKKIFKKYFGIDLTLIKRPSSTILVKGHKHIAQFFKQFVGTCAKNKRIPSELFNSNYNIQLSFLNGYLQDAHINKKTNSITYSTVHNDLAIDLVWLLRCMGIGARKCERLCKGRILPQGTKMRTSIVYDVIISSSESWLGNYKKNGQRTCAAKCLDKEWLTSKFYKNPSREMLKKKGITFGDSDLGMQKIKYIKKLKTKERVGDFSVEGTEKWFCGEIPILVHNTSELFGDVLETPQTEKTPFNPVSPYAEAKLKAHKAIAKAREEGMFACAGILFNNESPRRGLEFVTRKFTDGVARLKLGLPQRVTGKSYLELGNLEAKRDWGFTGDYVEAMWLMLQQEKPVDFVIATGKTRTIREFIEIALGLVDIQVTWKGKGLDEVGYDQNGKVIIKINKEYFRPNEVRLLLGNATKAKETLGWTPKTSFEELVQSMLDSDINNLTKSIEEKSQ